MSISDCFIDIIAYVAYFTDSKATETIPFDQVKKEVVQLLNQSEKNAELLDYNDYDNARFAVVTWIDERIMTSNWNARHLWQKSLLQRQLYKTTDGGILFFDRLKELGPEDSKVREVYYLCIALGFTGRYCMDDDDVKLDQLKSSNSKMLTGSSIGVLSVEGSTLFPGAYDTGQTLPDVKMIIKRDKLIYAVIGGAPILILIFVWFLFNFILNSEISTGLV